jgi:polygalacturonase
MKSFLICLFLIASTALAEPTTQPHRSFDVTDFGAVGDGNTNCTKQIQSAIDAAASAGGGMVTVPAGRFVTGTLWLRSNIELHLDPGAVIMGSQDENDFPKFVSKWEGPNVKPRHAALFCGENLDNVSLTGRGTVDARGEMWWKQKHSGVVREDLRPFTFRLIDSRNILISGLTFKNSPMWTLTPLACENVTIENVTIQNPSDSPNTDGINPESCSNVRISNCTIDVGDDCVTLKCGTEDDGRKEHRPTENVTITNCTMMHGHGGVVIGSEMSGSVRNVTISNCVFVGTDRGLRFKSRRGRGGVVEDVRANNIIMDGVLCPIAINLFYAPGAHGEKKVNDTSPWPVDDTTPRFRRLRFSNISAVHVKYAATFILGLPEMPVQDVSLDNVSIYLDPENKTAGTPEMAPVIEKVARGGIIAKGIEKLSLRNVDISDQIGPAVSVTDAKDLAMSDVSARTASSGAASFKLDNVQGAMIRGCSVPRSADVALHISGDKSADIHLGDNNFPRGRDAVDLAPGVDANAVHSPAPPSS